MSRVGDHVLFIDPSSDNSDAENEENIPPSATQPNPTQPKTFLDAQINAILQGGNALWNFLLQTRPEESR